MDYEPYPDYRALEYHQEEWQAWEKEQRIQKAIARAEAYQASLPPIEYPKYEPNIPVPQGKTVSYANGYDRYGNDPKITHYL